MKLGLASMARGPMRSFPEPPASGVRVAGTVEESPEAETRRRILAAAATELAAKGIVRARLAAIARSAGVSPALIRRLFGSKDGLLAAVLLR